ncbi:MAG: right-handed parallel beta-helix repeat-containing protein [Myxococcales bacterium]|nr:right-handed parallel beta-helix repeat-containing protein [Myxococcales bacterium]
MRFALRENGRAGPLAMVILPMGLLVLLSASARALSPPLFFVHGGNPGDATGFFAGDDDRPGIQTAIDDAMDWLEDPANAGAGPASVVFESGGTYHLDSFELDDPAFALIVRQLNQNPDWLHFVGNGATIVHRQLERQTLGIHASQNVLVENLEFDRDPLPYMDGLVEAVNGNVVTVRSVRGLSPLLFPPEDSASGNIRHWGWLLDPHIPGRPKQGSGSVYEASSVSLSGSDPDVYDFVMTSAAATIAADFALGDRFTYQYREGGNNLHIRSSQNIEVRNVTAYSASAMFVNSATTTRLSVIDSQVAIRPGRWRSTNGDGLHIKQSSELLVEGCSFQGVSDDGINVTEVDTFVVRNNIFTNKRRHAIRLDSDDTSGNPPNSSGGQIYGNHAAFNGGSFIAHGGGEYGLSIHSNNVSSNNLTRTFADNRHVRLSTRIGGFAAAGVEGSDGVWNEGDAVLVSADLSVTDTAWHFQEVVGGSVIIINRAARDDGIWLYVVPAQTSPSPGDPVLLRTGQGPDNPAAAEWFVEEIESGEFARIRLANTDFYLALQPSAGGPAVGDSVGVEASSSSDVNQVWRIEQLEDGDQGVPVPLLGAPGRLLLLGSLLAGAFLRVHAARARR